MAAAQMATLLLLLLSALAAGAQGDGEVAFALPPAPEGGEVDAAPLTCANPCFVVTSRYPFKTCGPDCSTAVCNRGYAVFTSPAICCEVSFPDGGCTRRPSECWVVESFQLRTCVRDDRKCLQGYGVFASEAACCAPGPGGAFPAGCANVTKAAEPCWVPDTYWPTRQCRTSRTLCGADSGVRVFANRTACCAANTGAFGEGCSTTTPPVPCWVVNTYYPDRTCRRSADVATCNRGWGVFSSEEVCCAQGAGFNEGCSTKTAAQPAAAQPATGPTPAAAAVAAPAPVEPAARVVSTGPAPPLPGAASQGA